MRYLIVSDIHANIVAFDAVLRHADGKFDRIWCLGDIVGYGPSPNECIERIQQFPHSCVIGNHDSAALDRLDLNDSTPMRRTPPMDANTVDRSK